MRGSIQALKCAIVLLGLSAWGNTAYDPDLGWHLFGGAWITEHGELPFADTINIFRPFWHDYHWMAEVILYSLFRLGNLDALRVLSGVVGALLGLTLFEIAERVSEDGPRPVRSFVLSSVALTIIRPYLLPRPQIFSFLIIAWFLYLTLKKPERSDLLRALVLTMLCVNMHVNWIMLPILWVVTRVFRCAACENGAVRWTDGGFFLLVAVGCTDPYAFITGNWLIAYRLLFEYALIPVEVQRNIGEMRSILQATRVELLAIAPLCFLGFVSLATFRDKRTWHLMALFIFAVMLAATSLKFLPLFAIFSLPAAVRGVKVLDLKFAAVVSRATARYAPLIGGIAFVVIALLAAIGAPLWYDSNRNLWAFLPRAECEEAALRAERAKLGRPFVVLTHFNEGGWCRWFAYEKRPDVDLRVTTDGRTQDIAPKLILDSFDLYDGHSSGEVTLRDWRPDAVLVPLDAPLATILARQNYWATVSESRYHRLYLRSAN